MRKPTQKKNRQPTFLPAGEQVQQKVDQVNQLLARYDMAALEGTVRRLTEENSQRQEGTVMSAIAE
jgi:hypothetical protein